MSFAISAGAICLIASHGGPADHFAAYHDALTQKGYKVEIVASGPALQKFKERKVEVKHNFNLEGLGVYEEDKLAQEIAKACKAARYVITDIGHSFAARLQESLAGHAPEVPRACLYDNPENYVPNYSESVALAIASTKTVLFANASFEHEKVFKEPGIALDFSGIERAGIGYTPTLAAAEKIRREREDSEVDRAVFLLKHNENNPMKKIWVYFGGNNATYFNDAFPAFLRIIQNTDPEILKDVHLVLQQHPGAKNSDLEHLEIIRNTPPCGIVISKTTSHRAQVVADKAFYYQTSMSPQFALAGIPCIQIGHEPFNDALVRNQIAPVVTNSHELKFAVKSQEKQNPEANRKKVLQALGIKKDWQEKLIQVIEGKPLAANQASNQACNKVLNKKVYALASGGILLAGLIAMRYFQSRSIG